MLDKNDTLSFIISKIDIFTTLIIPLKSFTFTEKITKLDLKVQKIDTETRLQLKRKDILEKKSNTFTIDVIISR